MIIRNKVVLPDPLGPTRPTFSPFCSAADANAAGDRYALRHQELAAATGLAFTRLKPPIENGDWNDVLRNTDQRSIP